MSLISAGSIWLDSTRSFMFYKFSRVWSLILKSYRTSSVGSPTIGKLVQNSKRQVCNTNFSSFCLVFGKICPDFSNLYRMDSHDWRKWKTGNRYRDRSYLFQQLTHKNTYNDIISRTIGFALFWGGGGVRAPSGFSHRRLLLKKK
jgi:hypothetical protein